MNPLNLVRRIGLASVVALFALISACADTSTEKVVGTSEHGGVTTINTGGTTTFMPNQPVTVNWMNMPGQPGDWVAIVTANSPPDQGFVQWFYTNQLMDGSQVFNGLGIGDYEARAYLGQSYTILAQSSFSVVGSPPPPPTSVTVTTDRRYYAVNQTVNVSWTGMPGTPGDWIAINTAGSPPDQGFVQWFYTNQQVNGSQAFSGLGLGNYEVRAYQGQSYTILGTAQISVSSIDTDFPSYGVNQPVVVTWAGMPGTPGDWVAIAAAGSPPDQGIVQLFFTNQQVSGSQQFSGLPAGTYEARTYLGQTYTIIASKTFTVAGAPPAPTAVMTNQATYAVNQPITVSWTGMPGTPGDWITINTAGSPPDQGFVQWFYTNQQVNGSQLFNGLGAGNYEARAYRGQSYTILAMSAFTVVATGPNGCTPPTNKPVLSGIVSGDIVIDATQYSNTVAMAYPASNSIVFTTVRENEPSPKHGGVMCALHDVDDPNMLPAGLTCFRGLLGSETGSTITVHYTVASFSSGVTVQRGIVNTGLVNPSTVSISPVDPNQSFVLLGGILTGGSGWGNNEFARAQLVNGSTLDIRTNITGSQVAWQVVTVNGASVQRGTTSLGSGALTQSVPVSAAPPGNMLLSSYTTDNSSGTAASTLMLRASMSDPSTVLFERDGSGTNLDVAWEVVSLPFATHSGLATFAPGQSSLSASTPGVTAATSVGLTTSQSILGPSTGSTNYAGPLIDLVGETSVTLNTGTDSVMLQRSASSASAEVPWTVIDFAHDCNGL